MANKQKILEIIYDAVDELNEQMPKKKKIQKKPDTVFFGKKGSLDSLGLVNLIVSIESLIDENLGKTITIADEKAMSQNNSPFRSIDSLANYVCYLTK